MLGVFGSNGTWRPPVPVLVRMLRRYFPPLVADRISPSSCLPHQVFLRRGRDAPCKNHQRGGRPNKFSRRYNKRPRHKLFRARKKIYIYRRVFHREPRVSSERQGARPKRRVRSSTDVFPCPIEEEVQLSCIEGGPNPHRMRPRRTRDCFPGIRGQGGRCSRVVGEGTAGKSPRRHPSPQGPYVFKLHLLHPNACSS